VKMAATATLTASFLRSAFIRHLVVNTACIQNAELPNDSKATFFLLLLPLLLLLRSALQER